MYNERPFFKDGKYYAIVDGKEQRITKEVAYVMNNSRRNGYPRKVKVKDNHGKMVKEGYREIPSSVTTLSDKKGGLEEYPDCTCDVESFVLDRIERQEVHRMIARLEEEDQKIIRAIYFENKKQSELAEDIGMSRRAIGYRLERALVRLRALYSENIF